MKLFLTFLFLLPVSLSFSNEFAFNEKARSMNRFENKVVIVTGASRGIGKGIAHFFASEGAKLVLVARDQMTLQEMAKNLPNSCKAVCICGDVANPEDMEKAAEQALSAFGKIDILCHNAGIYPHARLETMSLEDWQHVIDVNLTGTFLAIKACLPAMKAQKQGKIVVTSSISGPQVGLPGYSHYTASKGGVAGFIRTAAVELAKYNINLNAVEPGTIITESVEALGQEHMDNMIRAVPLGRLGTIMEVAYAVGFLASDEASYITGQSIIIDGGQTLPETHFADY